MPTYEFRCPDGHEFERFYRKISDATPELPCPECGKAAVRKLSGGAGLHFKGSGFYLTDYGKNAHRKSGSGAGSADTKSGDAKSGDAKSGDTSAAATSDAKSGDGKPSESKGESQASKPSETKSSGTTGGSSSGKTTDK